MPISWRSGRTAAAPSSSAPALPGAPAAAGGTAAAGPALPQGRCRAGPGGCSGAMAARVLNVNVGVLGHIDSGKTALARALSTTGSTAAFDRAPQSRARGITLDLGFSCLRTALPPQLGPGPGELQLTLVDCPGHASLIRTIIGGKGGPPRWLSCLPGCSGPRWGLPVSVVGAGPLAVGVSGRAQAEGMGAVRFFTDL